MEEILEILEKNFRYTDEQIAVMVGKTVEEVREAIQDYEEKVSGSSNNMRIDYGSRRNFSIYASEKQRNS